MIAPPRVDVLISTLNEEGDIDACLDAVASQTVTAHVTVVDGGSRDGTVARLRARAAGDPNLTVIADGVLRTLPDALNFALQRTVQPFIAKVDARTFLAPDFLERALERLDEQGETVACAGGQPEQFGTTAFGEAFALARTSKFGVGASGYADARAIADVDTVQCGVYRRSALNSVGGFDPALQFGEDEELNWRLRRAGLRIVRDSAIRFRYATRPTWRAGFRQYRNYGRARVAVWRKHPSFVRPHHFAPALLVAGSCALAAAAPFSHHARVVGAALFATYAVAATAFAVIASRDRPALMPQVTAGFVALHAGYGSGIISGLVKTVTAKL